MEKIKINKIQLSPIRQTILPEGFIVRVQKYKEILKEVEKTSLEETISNFQRDLNPERELAIWENIAYMYQTTNKDYPNLSIEKKKEAFGLILKSSLE
ncbi:MAG TPA: hypothetical protein PLD14_01670 [Candidatus Pacearchaeota archaeon]|nr:hypothetical protein [Candidatus Pacearchaeota archaeon]HPR79907.1 hypothetical protein [Candidatus Pacearchaeota archaeon]